MTHQRRTIAFWSLTIGVLILTELIFHFQLFHTAEQKMIDRLYLSGSAVNDIVVIAIDDASIASLGQWPWPRAYFGEALLKLPYAADVRPRAIGVDISFSEPSRYGDADDDVLKKALHTLKTAEISVVLPLDFDERGTLKSQPLATFADEALVGFINAPLEQDGVARFIKTRWLQNNAQSFSSVLANRAAPDVFRPDIRTPQAFTTFSFVDLMRGAIPSRIFQNKIVLFGVTAPNLHDFVLTPLGSMAGVYVHANAIHTLQHALFITDLAPFASYALLALIIIGTALLIRSVRHIGLLVLALSCIFFLIILGTVLAFAAHIVVPILSALIGFAGALIASLIFQYVTESKEKEFIRKSFQYYLTPHVIDELVRHPEKLSLGGESKHMTILFSDIRGFTTISEALTAQELTALLNEYLTAMTDIIMAHGGVVDKYIGDAIMAFWGAPLDNPHQANDACVSAANMIKKLNELNATWPRPLAIGIGMNTGTVVVGNMGSEKRFNYTVMGDQVNLASRLEGLTKYYHVQTIVSEATQRECTGLTFRELDLVVVKGKKEPTRIFELVTDELTPALTDALAFFAAGRDAYTAGKWDTAISFFEKAIATNNDGPSTLFIERCIALKKLKPKKWRGMYEFESK